MQTYIHKNRFKISNGDNFFARRKTLSYQPITSQQRKMPVN